MAEAAERQVEWTRKQYFATIAEIVAVVVTILVAKVAVGAAFYANWLTKTSSERQLRAYVGISKSPFENCLND